jgi:predicted GH43/DUF377 family glycosyl hydrolase
MKLSWKKMGLIFDPMQIENRPIWMDSFAQAPNAVMFDEFLRVYFCCRPQADAKKQFVSYCAFVDFSKDGQFTILNIAKEPILELGALGCFDEFGTYPVSVIKTDKELLAYYGGWTRCESVPFNISIGLARSADQGVSFKKIGSGPILSHSPDEPFVVTSPKIRQFGSKWYLTYTTGVRWIRADDGRPEIIYKLRMAISDDGVNWTKLNRNLIPDVLGENEAQACPDIFYANGKYHLFFCYREGLDFRTDVQRSYRIGYATSNDLMDWHRNDSVIELSASNAGWDSEMVAYPNVFEMNGQVYMIYAGNGNGQTGFGIAKLEGDFNL